MLIYGQRAIALGTTTANLIAGQVYEFVPSDALVEVALCQSATGLIASVSCDNNIALQDVGESNILVKATAPIYPDDFMLRFACVRGSRLVLAIRNPTGGALTVFYGVKITPV